MTLTTTVVGVEIAKHVVQLHWVEHETGEIKGLKLSRATGLDHVANRTPCVVAMEACGGAHHWGRQLRDLGHQVKLRSARKVKPFVSGNTNDAQDARAMGTAAQQPDLNKVALKSEAQQAVLALHRMRGQLMTCRHAQMNGLRGLLAEDGDVMPNGDTGMRRGIAAALERVEPR